MARHIKHDRSGLNYDSLFITSLGVGVALSWNAVVKEAIEISYPSKNVNSVVAHLKYAVTITIIAILILTTVNHVHNFSTFITDPETKINNIYDLVPNMSRKNPYTV